ncbi:hypothetical protein ACFYUY_04780 [Kitasatospora sp. NPDC004745]|uniref:hypothetical protein n=1 Tax=Kitasatospora sp. NPDC004745 TaxID=3364019 RepID=UPI0036C01CCA
MKIHAADLPRIATATAELLGADWSLDTDRSADAVAYFDGPDGCRAGIRTRTHGQTLQLWITGGDNTALKRGANYHAVLYLADVTEPFAAIAGAVAVDLFPAFRYPPLAVGHRPWLELDDEGADSDQPTPTPPQTPAPESDTADQQHPATSAPSPAVSNHGTATAPTTEPDVAEPDIKPARKRTTSAKPPKAQADKPTPTRARKATAKATDPKPTRARKTTKASSTPKTTA